METGGYRASYGFASCSFNSGMPFACAKPEQHWPICSSAWPHPGATPSAYGCGSAPALRSAPVVSACSPLEHSVPLTPNTSSQTSPAFPLTPQQAPRSFQPWMTDCPRSSSFAPPLLSSPWYTPAMALTHTQPAFETTPAYQPPFLADGHRLTAATNFSLPPTPPKEIATEDVCKSPDYVFQFNKESFRPPRDHSTEAQTTSSAPALPTLSRPAYPFPPPLTSVAPSAFNHLHGNVRQADLADDTCKPHASIGKFDVTPLFL